MKRLLVVVALVIGCAPTSQVKAERWPTPELSKGAHEYGGFPSTFFVTLEGAQLPFGLADDGQLPPVAAVSGWTILPAFALAQPAAYVVTEVWESHPDPWIQPVYMVMTGDPPTRLAVDGMPAQRTDAGMLVTPLVPITFGVGDASTFYSPYWQGVMVTTREPPPVDGADTRAVLAAAQELRLGGRPLCPIVPFLSFSLAATTAGPIHPFTQAPLKQLQASPVRVDAATTAYIDFGVDRFEATDTGRISPTRIFFFARMSGGKPTLLDGLPAVLSDNAVHSGYARRYDVVLNDEAVFVPAGAMWDGVRARFNAIRPDSNIPADVAAAYALRVAKSSSCFLVAADFPTGCQWLDSEAAIDRVEARRVIRTEVTLNAAPLLFGGEPL